MKMMIKAAGLAAMLASAALMANSTDQVVVNTDAQAIVEQQQQIRSEAVARAGRYKDMDEPTRTDLLRKQDRVFALLEGRERSTELSQVDQVTLFNSLEAISAIVNQAKEDRMVCRRERATGSNRTTNVCKTVAQMRAEQERAQTALSTRDQRCDRCGSGDSTRPEGW